MKVGRWTVLFFNVRLSPCTFSSSFVPVLELHQDSRSVVLLLRYIKVSFFSSCCVARFTLTRILVHDGFAGSGS